MHAFDIGHQRSNSVQTVKFDAGETILTEGEAGDTAFLIVSGSVEVSIGEGAKARKSRHPEGRRRLRRDEPDRAGAAIRHGQGA